MMITTKEEARGKWCPMVRLSTYASGSPCEAAVNRCDDGSYKESDSCLGSNCMTWRWAENEFDDGMQRGYCGLAGKP